MVSKPTIIIVAGPTASGKTATAVQLALHYKTAIISADSRQCFKELHIGVAKPSAVELETIPHYFINSHSVHQKVDAAVFEKFALATAEQLFKQHEIVIMAGGSGMYIKAFCEGLDAIPETKIEIQDEVRNAYVANGIAWLQAAVATEDPDYFTTGEINNPQRLMRALEVKRSTGNSVRYYQNKQSVERPFNIKKIGLQLPKEILNERINHRVDGMLVGGLVDEAKQLLPYRNLNALQTVGYKELFEYFAGKLSLPQAIEQIKIHTRQYAKRQMTWFKKDELIEWFDSGNWESLIDYIKNGIV